MKKLFSTFCILSVLMLLSINCILATGKVSFEMQNADMKPNRLFTVALSAKSDKRLSAATFEFTYDADYMEFRKVKAANSGSKIQVNKKSGNVKVVFLNSEGQNISAGKGGKSKHPTEPTTVNASDDEYIDYNPIKDRQIKFFLAGMGITAGCLAILAVAYAIGKKSAQMKAEKEKNHNDNTLENKTSDD